MSADKAWIGALVAAVVAALLGADVIDPASTLGVIAASLVAALGGGGLVYAKRNTRRSNGSTISTVRRHE